jgi:CheY-like chemotaxis protein
MSRPKILIVEDEVIVAEDLSYKARALGYQVTGIVSSGVEATEAARQNAFDIVLLDIHLDGHLDGIETAKALKHLCDPAIVFVTAHSDAQTVKQVEAISPVGYILKPFGERDLAVQLEIALHKHPGCSLDELILNLSGVSWSEVFLEVDRMSRSGQLRLDRSRSETTPTLRAA